MLFPIPHSARIHVAGHRGLVGGAVWRCLSRRGHTHLIGRSSRELDLTDRNAVFGFYEAERPEWVILAAAKVGGIMANSQQPADFLSENLRIQANILDAAQQFGVRRLLFLGSSCIYPKFASQPISEQALMTGPLEPTNDSYALAKIAGIYHVQALRRQHGCSFISAMPSNLYGPGDNFDSATSHVLPAMIRRFTHARAVGAPSVTLWGTGAPRREFLHVDDLAEACITLLENYDHEDPVNVGVGSDVSIKELASTVANIVGYRGAIEWDTSKPDGTPRKLLDVNRIRNLGWAPSIGLEDGITGTWEWFLQHYSQDQQEALA